MVIGFRKKAVIGLMAAVMLAALSYPAAASARNPFKDIFRGLRRTTSFIVKLPDKATRWMGPVLGPIASGILTQNLSRHAEIGRIFRNASQAQRVFQSIDEQKRVLGQVKDVYRGQADDLDSQIGKMQAVRDEFAQRMINDPDYGVRDYMDDVIELDRIIKTYADTAANLRSQADRMDTGTLIRMLGRDAIKDFLSGAEAIAVGELKNEINRFINPDIIKTFVAGGGGNVLDALLSGDIDRIIGQGDYGGIDKEALLQRIKDRIKDMAASQRDGLKNNWQGIIDGLVKDEIANIQNSLPDAPEGGADGAAGGEEADSAPAEPADLGPIPKDEHGCMPGYIWKPNMGISCVQEDCNSVASAHWSYEGYCVCGSSGSMNENPKDPNKECAYPPTYRSCPGCVYACVHLDEDCPELPGEGPP